MFCLWLKEYRYLTKYCTGCYVSDLSQLPINTTNFGSITNDKLMLFRVNTPSPKGGFYSGPPEQVMPIAAFAILWSKARLLFFVENLKVC